MHVFVNNIVYIKLTPQHTPSSLTTLFIYKYIHNRNETKGYPTPCFILVIHSSHLVFEHYSLSFSNSLLLNIYIY